MVRCKGLRGNTTRIVFGILLFIFFMSCFSSKQVNALTYTDSVYVKFTFNPAVSMSVSSNNLVISNLATGDYSDSNIIIVNVATNTVNGYTLTATVGNSGNATTDLKNTANNSYTLNSLATTDSLASMNNANVSSNGKWGFSFSTNDGSTWSNYSGLPLYTATGKTLYSTDSAENKNIWFKIGAKASAEQVAGTYANTVNFYLVTNPVNNSGINGLVEYMQDFASLTSSELDTVKNSMVVGEQYKLIDNRDGREYWVAKQADGNIWMTQNLDLCIGCTGVAALTSQNTDLNVSGEQEYSTSGNVITWTPNHVTSDYVISGTDTSANAYKSGGSIEGSDVYVYTSSSTSDDTVYTSLSACTAAGHTEDECAHYHRGNYYTYRAATAGFPGSLSMEYPSANSICPAGWKLPSISQYASLLYSSDVITNTVDYAYTSNGFIKMRNNPLYLVRSGRMNGKKLSQLASGGYYFPAASNWLIFDSSGISFVKNFIPEALTMPHSVRCVARLAGLKYLQDFNGLSSSEKSSIINSMASNTTYTLIDNRDGQSYQIAKLADGNVWIVDNLNLGYSTISTDLTSTNTNLNTTVTAATFNGWKKTSGSQTYTSGEFIPVSGTDSTSGTRYGTLYNYCAASAGTICTASNSSDAAYDICPAGWRLPTDNELATLLNNSAYNNNKIHASISSGGAAVALSGFFNTSGAQDVDNYTDYWSSVRDSGSNVRMKIGLTDGEFYEPDVMYRYVGGSIRCVLK
ncbi:hypothetical protein IKG33_02845 [Candidatus Saccharibacteria bacterium]|nr:hypothetical protein [Candidatus Saccharibacteria bacterium]